MAIHHIFFQLIAISVTLHLKIQAFSSIGGYSSSFGRSTAIKANPITSDGSKYRSDITEEEAFLWFDEAMVSVE